ncbi:MAG: hypothetical protein ACFNYP_09565, partial [Corynebacterium matruchotii]
PEQTVLGNNFRPVGFVGKGQQGVVDKVFADIASALGLLQHPFAVEFGQRGVAVFHLLQGGGGVAAGGIGNFQAALGDAAAGVAAFGGTLFVVAEQVEQPELGQSIAAGAGLSPVFPAAASHRPGGDFC